MLTTNNISLKINNKIIVDDVSIDVNKGEFIAMIGANGSGKSSFVKCISKLVKPSTGDIIVMDKSIKSLKSKEFATIVATMAQHNKTVDEITVYDLISYGRLPHKKLFSPINDEDKKIIDEALQKTDLVNFSNRTVATLSGGELQRVYLASCIVQEPKILILDEPTNHLDIMHQYKLLSLIRNLVKDNNLTVICVLHDINQAVKYADKLLVMKDGRIVSYGKSEDIVDEKMIKDIFSIDSKVYRDNNEIHIDFIAS